GEDRRGGRTAPLQAGATGGGGQRDVAARSTRHGRGALRPGFPAPVYRPAVAAGDVPFRGGGMGRRESGAQPLGPELRQGAPVRGLRLGPGRPTDDPRGGAGEPRRLTPVRRDEAESD